ncbi:YciI family protein [Stenotrophomonas sp. PD6]|uniref:YciI family protein n=1 Tax=Stenotrophomonas sp. PD6 TaxID=3368612 RepID=UPI003BA08868
MQFLLLIYIDEGLIQALPADEYDTLMRGCLRHADELQAQGSLVLAQQLEPVSQARTLRTRQAQARITDGPFAETRELLAGFNLINAADHDDAMRIAQGFPWSRYGSIEVRPLADMDAERRRVGLGITATA